MKKVIFWDFDGTLVYANGGYAEALLNAFRQHGYKIPLEAIKDFLMKTCSWYKPEISYPDRTMDGWWETLWMETKAFCEEKGIAEKDIDSILQAFRFHLVHFPYKVYEDAEAVLQYYMDRGFKNYILSNNYPELPKVICRMGLDKYFDGYIVSSHVGYEKPRKELYTYARSVSGNPEVCYMIGDNPIADIKGAEASGIPAVLVHRRDAADEVKRYCEQLEEIKQYIPE